MKHDPAHPHNDLRAAARVHRLHRGHGFNGSGSIRTALFLLLALAAGCRQEQDVPEKAMGLDPIKLPKVLDLMGYHEGTIVAEDAGPSQYLENYGDLTFGDLKVEYRSQGKMVSNAYSVVLTIAGEEMELVLPNVAHSDFSDLWSPTDNTENQ